MFTKRRIIDLQESMSPEAYPVRSIEPTWPDTCSHPLARAGISTVPLEGRVGIYDEVGHALIMFNAGAAMIWDLCDGTATFEGIVANLTQRFSIGANVIRDDVWQMLHKLARMGLVGDQATREPSLPT
jgi:hypothetical protein